MFYAKSTGGFYDAAIHGDAMPSDAASISLARYNELMAGQSIGRQIVGGPDGLPMLVDQPAPAPASASQQIDALEREYQLPRPVRDFMLGSMELAAVEQGGAAGLTSEQSLQMLRARNPGYRKVKELDEQIAALRALI